MPLSSVHGDEAITIVAPFLTSEGLTLAQVEIKTGRTHQIRCQASYHGHPLAGDTKYKGSTNRNGYYLHSCCIIAGKRTITAEPDGNFIFDVAMLMGCSENKVRTAIKNIISTFVHNFRYL